MEITIDDKGYEQALARFIVTSRKEVKEILRDEFKLLLKEVVRFTPPSSSVAQGGEAKKRAKERIRADIFGGQKQNGIFRVINPKYPEPQGVTQDGKVKIFTLKNGLVYGTENQNWKPRAAVSEMKSHHKRYFKNGDLNSDSVVERSVGNWRFVDKMWVSKSAMNAFLRNRDSEIFYYAAGWNRAANQLGLTLDKMVAKHSTSGGSFRVEETESILRLIASNEVNYRGIQDGMRRRLKLAVSIRKGKMDRRFKNYVGPKKQIKKRR